MKPRPLKPVARTKAQPRSLQWIALLMLVGASAAPAGDAPVILQEAQGLVVQIGGTVRLTCVVTGTAPISLIWRRDQVFLSNQTNAILVITNAQRADSGAYVLVAANGYGITQSAPAQVVVDSLPVLLPANLGRVVQRK